MRGMSDGPPALAWFRRDLRLADNPAPAAAARRPVLPVLVLDAAGEGRWRRARGRVADAVA